MSSKWRVYREMLEAKRDELSGAIMWRDEIEIENHPDVFDQVQRANERDLAVAVIDRNSHILRRVNRALERLADGSFGFCIECGGEISNKRLAAAPWAEFCLACQEEHERREPDYEATAGKRHSFEDHAADAA